MFRQLVVADEVKIVDQTRKQKSRISNKLMITFSRVNYGISLQISKKLKLLPCSSITYRQTIFQSKKILWIRFDCHPVQVLNIFYPGFGLDYIDLYNFSFDLNAKVKMLHLVRYPIFS